MGTLCILDFFKFLNGEHTSNIYSKFLKVKVKMLSIKRKAKSIMIGSGLRNASLWRAGG